MAKGQRHRQQSAHTLPREKKHKHRAYFYERHHRHPQAQGYGSGYGGAAGLRATPRAAGVF